MQNRLSHSAAFAAALALATMGLASVARAQITPGPGGMIDPGSLLRQGAAMAPKMEPQGPSNRPPALPGATSRSEAAAAPATHNPADMSPNDALFDAIDRGDIAAARDALSRGAELNAQNVLGMTPMELSVDLGRNDISFLLMSYRTNDTPKGPTSAHAKAGAPIPAGKAAAAAKPGTRASVMRVRDVVPTAPPQRTPHLFANDGGAPVPSAGFLGFDSGQAPR
jgi:hypothetical protein